MKRPARIALCVACLLSFSAAAQWQWIDPSGRRVYSDIAPPTSVPDKNIVRRPAQTTPAAETAATANPAQPPASATATGTLDRMLAEQKLRADQAQAGRRQADEARQAGLKADNCQRAKRAKAALDSGARMGVTNAQGEREIMDETARAAEARRLQAIIDSECP